MTGAEPPGRSGPPSTPSTPPHSAPPPDTAAPAAPAEPGEGPAQVWQRDLLLGLAAVGALAAGEGVFMWIYHPPGRHVVVIIALLLGSAVLALLLGMLALAAGPRVGLRTIRHKMAVSVSLGALFAFGDALVTAQTMAVTPQDAYVVLLLLLFSLATSLALVLSLAGMIGRAIAVLMHAARRMATGRLDTPVPVASGDELAVLGTDLQQMAAGLAEAQRRQRALEEAQRDLVVGISHDLRTPLNALQAVASALADGLVAKEPATAAHYARALDAQVARLTALVEDLLTLARLEGPAPRLDRAPYPTADLLSNLLQRTAPLAQTATVRLEVTVAPPTPAVLVDVRQVERVLDNLVQNALRHTPPGGMIMVQAAPYGDAETEVIVSVCDTGTGIAPSDLPLLFERYYRGRSQAESQARGTDGQGLGLAIVKAVVQAHGGRVWATSPPPGLVQGTCINVVLPAATTPEADKEAGNAPP